MQQRLIATLASWPGSPSLVEPGSLTLQGFNGSTWTTIDAGDYVLGCLTGLVWQNDVRDDGAFPDWSAYSSWRATYKLFDTTSGVETTKTNELVTGVSAGDGLFVVEQNSSGEAVRHNAVGANSELEASAAKNLIATYLYFTGGAVNGPFFFGASGYIDGNIISIRQAGAVGLTLQNDTNPNIAGSAVMLWLPMDFQGQDLDFTGCAIIGMLGLGDTVALASDFTTISNSPTLVDVTGLSLPIAANAIVELTGYLSTNQSGANGLDIGINAPSGATIAGSAFGSDGSGTFLSKRITAVNTPYGPFNNVALADGMVWFHVVVTNGVNAGTLQVRTCRGTTTGTVKIYANSTLTARVIG